MVTDSTFGKSMFPADQPWDVVFDALWVSYSEFWLVAGSGPGADFTPVIPDGDSVQGNGGAVGVPTSRSTTRIEVALSVWDRPAPDGTGTPLGTARIEVPDREVALVNVEGREPGPVLVLPEADEYQVKVWRCPVAPGSAPERYDIRLWPYSEKG
ncbi:hypothetical protein M5362_32435 [Streptomyces sp. Je 1-79]|uniref:hypothetical protein n=1 Tax=Streptomyces sp. Je 1-79 TaxID=2943847 RepID=UPI0021A77B7E|nr:hypothetical protein [Streptomyces sp. Je 1-79]MCT4357816.1 hypothetical protein [Streptomyces sp. Je 1-79]